jgi:hypothetical protein
MLRTWVIIALLCIESLVLADLRIKNETYGHDTAEIIPKRTQLGGKYLPKSP